jgi:hypothetical protein
MTLQDIETRYSYALERGDTLMALEYAFLGWVYLEYRPLWEARIMELREHLTQVPCDLQKAKRCLLAAPDSALAIRIEEERAFFYLQIYNRLGPRIRACIMDHDFFFQVGSRGCISSSNRTSPRG